MLIIEVKSGFVCGEMSKYYDKGNFFLLIFILSFYIPLVNIFVTNVCLSSRKCIKGARKSA